MKHIQPPSSIPPPYDLILEYNGKRYGVTFKTQPPHTPHLPLQVLAYAIACGSQIMGIQTLDDRGFHLTELGEV